MLDTGKQKVLNKISAIWWVVIAILCLTVFVFAWNYFDVYDRVLMFLRWLDQHQTLAPVLFIITDILVVVLVLPGVLLTLGAGFLFGVVNGTFYVVIATTIGATIAFILARYILRSAISGFFISHPRLSLVNVELAKDGWKIVLLTRLIPFFPFKLSNYFFGLTQFTLRGYVFGTLVGIMPITMFNVYIGSLAADLTRLGAGGLARTPLEWAFYGAGGLIALATVVYIIRLARKALDKYMPQESKSPAAE